jgi:hypothetical protein
LENKEAGAEIPRRFPLDVNVEDKGAWGAMV